MASWRREEHIAVFWWRERLQGGFGVPFQECAASLEEVSDWCPFPVPWDGVVSEFVS